MKLVLIIIIIFLVVFLGIAIKSEARDIYWNPRRKDIQGGNGKIHYKGLGNEDESIETLLNRIYWVADSDGRNAKWKRSYIISFMATLLIICAIYKNVPSPRDLVILLICIFVVVMATTSFFRFHSDRFAPYYVRRNIQLIQQKLNLKTHDPGPPRRGVSPPDYSTLNSLL